MIGCHLGGNLLRQYTYQKYEYKQKISRTCGNIFYHFTYQQYVTKGVSQ